MVPVTLQTVSCCSRVPIILRALMMQIRLHFQIT